ncbi:uncharacterized protein LOC141610626 [Silene latifolia]|uniref:uncharacterized protein LOC141610626 n=1 Tax=Silene latifolia TaxID=37657 RepID=UPI003D76EB96
MPSLEAYCTRLRELAGMLKDVDAAVTDRRLVIQLVRGLPSEYDTVASYINQTSPNFETARSMLELEQHRKVGRDDTATALAVPTAQPTENWVDPNPPPTSAPPRQSQNNNNNGNRNYRRNNNNNKHNHNNSNASGSLARITPPYPWTPPSGWPAQWAPPPCPYPTYPGWTAPWPTAPPPQYRPQQQSRYQRNNQYRAPQGQAYVLENEAPQPTDLSQVFHALSVEHNMDPWYMDTGASSHLTSDPGYSDWEPDSSE